MLAETFERGVHSVPQFVELCQKCFVDELTVDLFGGGEQDLGGCCEPDEVATLGETAAQCAPAIPCDPKLHAAVEASSGHVRTLGEPRSAG